MDITLHYTKDELKIILDALNNGYNALGNIYFAALLGLQYDLPKELADKFNSMSSEEIDSYTRTRMKSLKELYEYLLTFEKQ